MREKNRNNNIIQFTPRLHWIDCPGFDESKYETFRVDIVKSFESDYLFCIETMPEDDEMRIEARKLFANIQIGSVSKNKDIITQHLQNYGKRYVVILITIMELTVKYPNC